MIRKQICKRIPSSLVLALTLVLGGVHGHNAFGEPSDKNKQQPLVLKEHGSFSVGGSVACAPGTFDATIPGAGAQNTGQCFRVDQLYAQYKIPPNARKLPIVMIHGGAGTGRVWETTPDGREGFESIFVRRGFAVYVVDAPRGGRASTPTFNGTLGVLSPTQNFIPSGTTSAVGDKQAFYSWRLGAQFPTFFPNSQFPQSGLEQFLQAIIPGIGTSLVADADGVVALLDRIGPAILMVHSLSGAYVWNIAFASPNVRGIINFEGGYVFPPDAVPPPLMNCAGTPVPQGSITTTENFMKLTQIPTLVMYGDNQPTCPEPNRIRDGQQLRPIFGKSFVDALNAKGGNAHFIWTPEIGVFGNSHFLFLDRNNVQIADLVSDFMKKTGLDKN